MTRAKELGITQFPYYEKDDRGRKTYVEWIDGDWAIIKYEGDEARIERYRWTNGNWNIETFNFDNEIIAYEDYQGNYWTKDMCEKNPFV